MTTSYFRVIPLLLVASSYAAEQPLTSRGVENRVHPILGCLKRPDVGLCLQKSVFGYLEDWLLNGEEANGLDRSEEDLASMHPYLSKVVDGLADAITTWNTGGSVTRDDNDDEDEDEEARQAKSPDTSQPEGRLHKKKKLIRKAVRRAIIKLIIIALLIKHKIRLLLHGFTTLVQLKFLLLAGLYVVANAIKVWAEIKHKHHPHKPLVYHESAYHNHFGEGDHHSSGYGGYGTDPYGDYHNAWNRQTQTVTAS